MNLGDLVVHTPGFSVQDLSHTNILSAPFGKVFPVLIEPVHPNETIEVDFDWLCRTFPLNAPLMDNVEIAFDAFWVPYRVLGIAEGNSVGFNFENFFNPANLTDTTNLPRVLLDNLQNLILNSHGRLDSTLYDYLGYPTHPEAFRRYNEWMNSISVGFQDYDEDTDEMSFRLFRFPDFDLSLPINPNFDDENYMGFDLLFCSIFGLGYFITGPALTNFLHYGASYSHPFYTDVLPSSVLVQFGISTDVADKNTAGNQLTWILCSRFTAWVVREYMHICKGYPYKVNDGNIRRSVYEDFQALIKMDDPFGHICSQLSATPSQLYDEWRAWLIKSSYNKSLRDAINYGATDFNVLGNLYRYNAVTYGPLATVPNRSVYVNILPFMLYDRIIQDWYVNPLLVDGENRYYTNWHDYFDPTSPDDLSSDDKLQMKDRLWSFNDPFVTATTVSGQPNVLLPANPSVKDIRNMNRLQLMLERISKSGKRYIDQILTTFGIQPSDARVDRSEVLFRRTAMLDFQTVTQTSQADFGKLQKTPLGMQVGQSTSFQTFPGNTITFDEHGFYVIMCSLRPNQSYFQGLNQHLKKTLASQFLVPDFAQIGDQYVTEDNIYLDFSSDGQMPGPYFGYNQRYWEYMYHGSEIHGLMQNELDYYHLGRRFSGAPVLNEQFTSVDSDDNELYRIFTSWDRTPFLMWINFKEKMLRPLPSSSTYTL